MKIEVLTSITGDKDHLLDDRPKGNATFTAFVDDLTQTSTTWNLKPAPTVFKDPRRNSRMPKIVPHLFSDADIIIWMDGNKKNLVTPEELVDRYLQDYDMAIFSHVMRDCVYDEATTCAKLKLDDPEIIIEQAKYYEDHGFLKHMGLCEGGFIIRRNIPRVRDFNNEWWANYCRFSRRDQLSLMPSLVRSKVRVNFLHEEYIPGPDNSVYREGKLIQMFPHKNFSGNFNDPNR